MALVKTVRLNIVTDPGDSRLKLDAIDRKAEEIGRLNPEVKVQVDTMASQLKLAVLKEELRTISAGPIPGGTGSGGLIGGVIGSAGSAGGAGASGLAGIASLGPVGAAGLAAVAVAAAAAALALAPVAAALLPVTVGFGGLAAVAGPEVVKVFQAMTEHGTALKKTLASLTPAEKDLVTQVQPLKDQFHALAKAVQPEIMKAFGEGIRIIKDLMPTLKPLVEAAAKALDVFLKKMADWLESPSGQSFIHWLETVGPKDIKNFGRVLWDVANGVGNALYYIYKTGSWIDRFLTHWGDDWKLVKDVAAIQWDEIKIGALKLVYNILQAFTHIPFIGGQFKKARDAIGIELGRIDADNRRAIADLQAAWDRLHGKKVSIQFTTAFVASHGVPVAPTRGAKGMRVPGYGGGDKWPALLEGGEAIVPKHLTPAVAPFLKAHGVPGFAAGGIAGGWDITEVFRPSVATDIRRLGAMVSTAENAAAAYVRANPLKYWKFGQAFGGAAGPGGGAPGANAALAMLMYSSRMGPGDWAAWNYVAMRESGWNQFATNPTSGAYGIPQALPFSKMPRAAWPAWAGGSSNPAAQISWMWNYMAGVYGGPKGAAQHEATFNWYDQGGWLPPGISIAANGTGRPERVGGGDTYNITVNVPPTANPRETARQIADILNQGATAGVRLRQSIISGHG